MTSKRLCTLEPGFSIGGPIQSILPEQLIQTQFNLNVRDFEPNTDRYWMLQALLTSLSGIGITNPNPAVGCVLVDKNGIEISRGSTQAYPGIHAECSALQKVLDPSRLVDAVAYVTLEPCSHHGNQPPCIDVLIASPIKRIIISRSDPDPRVNGEGIRKLKEAGKQVEIGLLHLETTAWNFPFFASQLLKRPICILKWAQTLDGQLADDSNRSQWISGPTSRAYTHWLRQRYDAILVGAGTLLADHPRLNVRDSILPHQNFPVPVILDPKGLCFQIDREKQKELLSSTFISDRSTVIITTEESYKKQGPSWTQSYKHLHVLRILGKNLVDLIDETLTHLQTEEVQNILGHRLQSLFIEGGPKTHSLFLKAGYADLIHAFIAPVMTGGQRNRISLNASLKDAERFKKIACFSLDEDTVLELTTSNLYEKLFEDKFLSA